MGEGGINNSIINSGSGLDLFPQPLGWRDSRSARPSLRTRAPSCRAGRIAGRCAAPAPGPRGQVGPSGSSSGLEGFSFSASASPRVSSQGSGKRQNKEPHEGFKKLPPTPLFFFLKSHFLKGFLRVFRLGGRGRESGASAAPPNHPACCAQSQPASPRLGAGLSTEGRTVAAAQGSRAWNALGAHSAAGRWSPLFLRRGPRGWLCRPCDDQAVLLLGDQQVPSLGRSLPMCTTTERNLNISKTLLL